MVLIAIPNNAAFFSQVLIADALSNVGYDICILFTYPESKLQSKVKKILSSKSWKIVFSEEVVAMKPTANEFVENILVEKIKSFFPDKKGKEFKSLFNSYRDKMNRTLSFLKALSPDILIVSSDGIAADMILCSAVKNLNIPVICCPYGFCGEQDLLNDLDAKIKDGRSFDTGMLGGSFVKKLFPKWVKLIGRKEYLMFKPDIILARECAGISLRQPWRVYGSDADFMCVPSNQYKKYLMSEGFYSKKIKVVGSIYGDCIWDSVQSNVAAQESFRKPQTIQNEKVKVLLSLPPNYHKTRGQFTASPGSYNDFVALIIGELSEIPNLKLTVSAHPSTKEEDFLYLSNLNVKVSKGEVIELIPLHDIFIADYSSSIRWAIASGKPVVNYDFYNFNLGVYEEAGGVLTVRKQEDFKKIVIKLISDKSYFSDIASKQIKISDSWGIVDGLFADRLARVIDRNSIRNRTVIDRFLNLLSHKIINKYKKSLWLKYQLIFGRFD